MFSVRCARRSPGACVTPLVTRLTSRPFLALQLYSAKFLSKEATHDMRVLQAAEMGLYVGMKNAFQTIAESDAPP